MREHLNRLFRMPGADKILLLLLAGILLLFSFGSETGMKDYEENTEIQLTKVEQTIRDYDELLEERLENILEECYGKGHVNVMITLEESENKVLATINEECIFDGDSPYVVKSEAPMVRGVVVIIDSDNSSKAALEITQACEVLLGVPSNRVKVISKK